MISWLCALLGVQTVATDAKPLRKYPLEPSNEMMAQFRREHVAKRLQRVEHRFLVHEYDVHTCATCSRIQPCALALAAKEMRLRDSSIQDQFMCFAWQK